MSGRLLALVLLVLALLGGVAWFVVRGDGARGAEEAGKPGVEIHADPRTQLSAESPALEARSVEPVEAGSQSSANTSASAGSGTLRLRVLDEATRAPIAGLAFVVYRERGGVKELARGTTDAAGRAELREIEANTVIVRTERKPPHAESYGAVWLTPGATKELEILAGTGGAVAGRVVDDERRPVSGAEIRYQRTNGMLPGFPGWSREPDARSGPDGTFRLESLTLSPGSVWIVDGSMRAQAWNEVYFSVGYEGVWVSAIVRPKPGETVPFGDIQVSRSSNYSGTVRDAQGMALAGALVSPGAKREARVGAQSIDDPYRRIGPGQPGFELLPGEVESAADGSFALRADGRNSWVVVWAGDVRESFQLPSLAPGQRADRVELRLHPHTRIELELVDGSGQPARVPAFRVPAGDLYVPWRRATLDSRGIVSLVGYSKQGDLKRSYGAERGADGIWHADLLCAPAEISKLEVAAPGYEPQDLEPREGFSDGIRQRLALAALPTLHVKLVVPEGLVRAAKSPAPRLQLHVCMAAPAQHARALNCCGFGSYWNGPWQGEARELELPVRRAGRYWIYARRPVPNHKPVELTSIGPFEPGSTVRELSLDPAALVDDDASDADEPPPALDPGADPMARLEARILDAITREPIPYARLEYCTLEKGNTGLWGLAARADADARVHEAPMFAGRFGFSAVAEHFTRLELGSKRTRPGEALDLGTLLLERAEVHRGRVLAGDGTRLGRDASILVCDPGDGVRFLPAVQAADDGTFEIVGKLRMPARLDVTVARWVEGVQDSHEAFLVEDWPADRTVELRLASCRAVFVTLRGLDPEESVLVPEVCPAPGEPAARCDHHRPVVPEHSSLARGFATEDADRARRFGFLLAPGRYVVWGANALHELEPTAFEVVSGEDALELTLGVR